MGLQADAAEKTELLDQVDLKRVKISRKWAVWGGRVSRTLTTVTAFPAFIQVIVHPAHVLAD
jgi:hypothetical protein